MAFRDVEWADETGMDDDAPSAAAAKAAARSDTEPGAITSSCTPLGPCPALTGIGKCCSVRCSFDFATTPSAICVPL